jgi:hypothetical protein
MLKKREKLPLGLINIPLRYIGEEDFWYSFMLEAESTPGPQCGWND